MEDEGSIGVCTVCQSALKGNDQRMFHQAPVCRTCWENLSLEDLSAGSTDVWLKENTDKSGSEVLKGFMAITYSYPRDYGWNILAVLNTIGETVENPQQRSMLEQSALLAGATVIKNASESGDEPDPRLLSLYLVLGQFLILSIMKRIVIDDELRTGNILDEVKLIGCFNRKMFDHLRTLDPGEDQKLEKVLAQALSRVV